MAPAADLEPAHTYRSDPATWAYVCRDNTRIRVQYALDVHCHRGYYAPPYAAERGNVTEQLVVDDKSQFLVHSD